MKNVIGQPARGENFYERSREVKRVTNSLANGNNIQITAPRRVGKTSILWFLLDNDVANRHYVYVDTESVEQEQDFYKKLLVEILRNAKVSGSKKLLNAFEKGFNKLFKKLSSITIAGTGLEFSQDEPVRDYFEELQNFLEGYAATEDIELVLLIDEFPQTVENLKQHSEEAARTFLKSNRSLRMNPALKDKIKFIYTGSIGLNHTVARLDATATINDLNSIEVGPLREAEALDLFHRLLHANRRSADATADKALLELLQWYIPFHIQLIVQELIQQGQEDVTINEAAVRHAVEQIIDLRNQNHFDHYNSRLKSQFKDNAFRYADELLKRIAEKDSISKAEAADLAVKYSVSEDYRRILESLIYDGYIHLPGTTNEYRFNSPIVKMWWQKFIC